MASSYFVFEGLDSKVFVLTLLVLREPLDAIDIDSLLVLRGDAPRCVVGVFHFHSNVSCLVDWNTSCSVLARANSHVEVEGGVGFVLAVLDAGLLGGGLGAEGVAVDAVNVAAAEKEGGKGGLHESFALVLGVFGPGARGLSH